MDVDISAATSDILAGYDPASPAITADRLRDLWLSYEPVSVAGIKAEARAEQETIGIPVPVLKTMGKATARVARRQVETFIPLARLLWEAYGREGRVVAAIVLGTMELTDPETIVPLLMTLGRTCITWEDADRLAMDALEPIVRKMPEPWLPAMDPWLDDANKWVRRAGVTVVGRLCMKHGAYTSRCLSMIARLLPDDELDVKRAVSFAIRLAARGDTAAVATFLAEHVPPEDPVVTWVLCDAIRSMAKKLLPDFGSLLPSYENWANDPTLSHRDRRSVESAVKTLRSAAG